MSQPPKDEATNVGTEGLKIVAPRYGRIVSGILCRSRVLGDQTHGHHRPVLAFSLRPKIRVCMLSLKPKSTVSPTMMEVEVPHITQKSRSVFLVSEIPSMFMPK